MIDVKIERLCSHHAVDKFSCGPDGDYFETLLEAYRRDFVLARDEGKTTAVFVAAAGVQVAGYVAVQSFEVGANSEVKQAILLPAAAIDVSYQGTDVLLALIRHVLAWRDVVDPRHEKYTSIGCIPHLSERVDETLSQFGFRPRPDDEGFFWWRPLP